MVDSSENATRSGPLLETKLFTPQPRAGLVSRPRLVERIEQVTEVKLVLISAPAGFGKTTLLSEWLAATAVREQSVAWVSLDRNDNDPTQFWLYVFSALQKALLEVSDRIYSLLQPPQPPIELALTTLINEISSIEFDVILVLDDLHFIDTLSIFTGMEFLLDHLPPQLHLIISSRADPPFPLAQLRGRSESIEIRAADLRFTPEETSAFLNDLMELDLAANDVAVLEQRTEGWIAGLQLAALSMRARDDVSGFIAGFAGDNRYIIDFLIEEVLQQQTDTVRVFLLQTSILARLCGPLCDAITGRNDGKQMLEGLERDNLFVVPLDDKRHWYRYHHLFADVLQAHLMGDDPEHIAAWHQRAAAWYEQNDLPSDAIHHALAAEDFDRAARLIELAWRPMDRRRRVAVWHDWAKALPAEQIHDRPVLNVAFAWALLESGELEAGDAQLRASERLLDQALAASRRMDDQSSRFTVSDEEEFRFLHASIASARAYHAQAVGDLPGTLMHARQALDLLPEQEYVRRGSPAALLALAEWTTGDLEAAARSMADAITAARTAGDVRFIITGTFVLTELLVAQGRLRAARDTYHQALELVAAESEAVLRGAADLYTGLGRLHCEWNDLESAEQHLLRSKELGDGAGLIHWRYRWCRARAQLEVSRGNLPQALELFDEAERQYVRGPVPETRPVAALKARIWVAQGNLSNALDWVADRSISADDNLGYAVEFEYRTLARILIARYTIDGDEQSIRDAARLLRRLRETAEDCRRTGSVIPILVLQALAHEARDNISEALMSLECALRLAESEGYIRVFLDEGPPMRNLLGHAVAAGISGSYARRLLSAFDEPAASAHRADQAATGELIEPLTARESEVLRLIAAGLKNQEIADRLYISLSTVKRHIANIYGKLGVDYRTEAVARANELNLL